VTGRDRLLQSLAPEVVDAIEQLVRDCVRDELDATPDRSNGRNWLTFAEAGERLGCSADAIRMRVNRGRLESERQGRRRYVSASSVERLR
jgi:excisionase family DNA binding protein